MSGLIEIAGFSYLLLHSVYCSMLFGLKYIYREKSSLTQLMVEKGRDILIASKELWIYFIGVCVCARECTRSVTQLCPALCNPQTVALQAAQSMGLPRQDWVAISSCRGSSWPRDWTGGTSDSCVSCIVRWIFYHWATWKALYLVANYIKTQHITVFSKLCGSLKWTFLKFATFAWLIILSRWDPVGLRETTAPF